MEADYGQLRNWLEEVIEEKACLEARIEELEGDKAEVRLLATSSFHRSWHFSCTAAVRHATPFHGLGTPFTAPAKHGEKFISVHNPG